MSSNEKINILKTVQKSTKPSDFISLRSIVGREKSLIRLLMATPRHGTSFYATSKISAENILLSDNLLEAIVEPVDIWHGDASKVTALQALLQF